MKRVTFWETRDGRLFKNKNDAIKREAFLLGLSLEEYRRIYQNEEASSDLDVKDA